MVGRWSSVEIGFTEIVCRFDFLEFPRFVDLFFYDWYLFQPTLCFNIRMKCPTTSMVLFGRPLYEYDLVLVYNSPPLFTCDPNLR